jgi:histidinol dehydrogenase
MVAETVRALRPTDEDRERVKGSVADIVEMVRSGGDAAVRRLTARLDGVDVEHARYRRLQSSALRRPRRAWCGGSRR